MFSLPQFSLPYFAAVNKQRYSSYKNYDSIFESGVNAYFAILLKKVWTNHTIAIQTNFVF
ncbi:hypothetical protein IV38_GL002083 [Lactobacillus selangorensis]|uniref:Uncharacterized protein n=1 Tax=Lactobacillus selangorensis TaxID=81857 RepID=A0A0R2G1W2_9LACO|nr:hypothetical protein IV38_GL002083 [Lactobacillus selangorensis]KRN31372.1 hypothetical protein IV40_GL001367 [Lactobacillus selangorensis]